MTILASSKLERDPLKLLLAMQLRPSDTADNLEFALLARNRREETDIAKKEKDQEPRTGEFKTVPVTTTTVEGIGTVSNVYYGIITFEVTKDGVKTEKRAVWGQNTSGFMTFNE